MDNLTLIIGNKNYSSWSLRPWLLMKQAGIPFVERCIPIRSEAWAAQIPQLSPSGKVPALHDGALQVWDSLAICEYLAERFPEKQLWPADRAARAVARAVSAEMHSGFQALRQNMFVNIPRAAVRRRHCRTSNASSRSGMTTALVTGRPGRSCSEVSASPMPCTHRLRCAFRPTP
jgi:glutathione S-transferase